MESASCSGEHVSVGEGVNIEHLASDVGFTNEAANVPAVRLLEDTLPSNAECIAQGIESGFGGDGLPSAVKHFQGVFRHGGDVVAMEVDLRIAGLRVEGHRGVSVAPVFVLLDRLDHLGFDLAHLVRLFQQCQYKGSGGVVPILGATCWIVT